MFWRAVLGMAALACVLLVPRLSWASPSWTSSSWTSSSWTSSSWTSSSWTSSSWTNGALQCAEASEPVFASLLADSPLPVDAVPAEDDGDGIDVAGTPMSLSAGASAVAPHPIDNPSDARIEAVKRCQDDVENDIAQAPHDDAPLPEPSSVMAAALPMPLALPAFGPRERDPFAPEHDVPRTGVRRTVDRPPRA